LQERFQARNEESSTDEAGVFQGNEK